RSFTLAWTLCANRSAMQFNEVFDNRQSEAEAAESSRDGPVCLLKSIEDLRKEMRFDSHTGSGRGDPGARICSPQRYRDPAALRRELDGIGEQVPHDLLKTC